MERPDPHELEALLAASNHLQPSGAHRRQLLAQNGLLAVERVRDPIVIDAIVVSIGDRARVLRPNEFRSWLDEVRQAFDAA
jgi:hypothetical protein